MDLYEFLRAVRPKNEKELGDDAYIASCPCQGHGKGDGDKHPSLSITAGDKGGVVLYCHAGCHVADIVAAYNLTMDQVMPEQPTIDMSKPRIKATYSYVDEAGDLLFQVVRYEPRAFRQRRPLGDGEWSWKLGDVRRVPYRLPELIEGVAAGKVIYIAEGEKDVEALRDAGVVATCNPHGAGKWRESYNHFFHGADVVIVQDKDKPGREHAAAVRASLAAVAATVRIVQAAEGKDAYDHLSLGHSADDFVVADDDVDEPLPAEPVVVTMSLSGHHATLQPDLPPADLRMARDLLHDFAVTLHARGVCGEDRLVKVVYLALTSRVLDRPVSVAIKGPSSAGKSFNVDETIKFFPASAVYALSAMSERALAYSQEPLSHRFLVLYEAAGMSGEFATYLLRSLLSEGCIRYETVEKMKGEGMKPRLIEREGPTGLIVTTTAVSLHPENETRLLSVPANDTREQTKHVLRSLAAQNGRVTHPELTDWHDLQLWIEQQDNRVAIPFALALAELVPPVAVRLRRDFTTVLNLVRAHAILHQGTRQRDDLGRIVAVVDDYAAVHRLVADLVADEVGATVPPAIVETVQAVTELHQRHEAGVTYLQLGERLGLDKSAAMRRAKVAASRGYVQNMETRRGQPAKLVPGDPLPGEVTILPRPEDVEAATVVRLHGDGRDTSPVATAGVWRPSEDGEVIV